MKKLLMILVLVLMAAPAMGAMLVCDIPTEPVIGCEVETNSIVAAGICTVDGSDYLLKNLDSLPSGIYAFRVRFIGEGGWPSDWSAPFDASKPGISGSGLRIKR